jgi:hypothetical protein
MKPEVDQILGLSAQQLMGVLGPQLPAGYAQGSASILGVVMMLSAQEYDRAADIRASENADMRALFRGAAGAVSDTDLKSSLLSAAESRDASLKISMLNAANAELRHLLIRLQAHAEEKGEQALQRRIWGVLKASADRRLLRLA